MADDDPTRRVPTEDLDDRSTARGLSAGRKVFGRYVLETELGAGGSRRLSLSCKRTTKSTILGLTLRISRRTDPQPREFLQV
jgi:hypothetical protein